MKNHIPRIILDCACAGTSRRSSVCNLPGQRISFALLVGALAWAGTLGAQPINVPNFSFESQTAPNAYPYVNIFVDSWQKVPEPAYYAPAIGIPFGIPWIATAGVFLDVNPYGNRDGLQVGYLLGFPQVTLFQDYDSSPGHEFNATFEVGQAYNMTVGIFGKNLAPNSTLELSLYYRDALDNKVPVGSTTVVYTPAGFPNVAPLNLVDFEVNVPIVQADDAWAGKNIGIQFESTVSLALAGGGYWDLDDVRLNAVPEPGVLGLLSLGVGALVLGYGRFCRQGTTSRRGRTS